MATRVTLPPLDDESTESDDRSALPVSKVQLTERLPKQEGKRCPAPFHPVVPGHASMPQLRSQLPPPLHVLFCQNGAP